MVCRRYKKVICLGLAVIIACLVYVYPMSKGSVVSAESINESKSKQSDLQAQNSELNDKLKALKESESEQVAYKETLDAQIKVVEQQIDEANRQIDELDRTIEGLENSISGLQESIDKNFDVLKQRLKAIYMAGDTSVLDIILGAKSFSDFLDKREIVKSVSDHDSDLIATLQKDVDSISAEKAEIEEARRVIAESKSTLDAKQSELTSLIAESQRVLEQIEGEKKTVLDQIDENDSEIQRINSEIAAYYAKQQASSSSSSQSASSDSSQSVVAPSGSIYIWPVPGFYWISSPYGEFDPIRGGRMHTGIDIAGSGIYGKAIVAAASGRVKNSEWIGGYGNCIIIDHGNGRATLYAHMSSRAVSEGEEVVQGQTIGYVGTTGNSTGPHLHFETRHNGNQYDPLSEF